MARNVGTTVENQFIQGLITEATGINFPEKAVAECWNVRFEKTGNVTRRLGYAYEDNVTAISSAPVEAGVCKSFLWKAVGTDGSKTFLVIQSGSQISFYEPDADGNFSGGLKSFAVNLDNYKTSIAGVDVAEAEAGIASGNGRLYINHPYCDPIYIAYDSATDSIDVTRYTIYIRDMEGVDDGLDPGTRPSSLSNLHKYNLWNQGWNHPTKVPWGFNESGYPIDVWRMTLNRWPSNNDVWWWGKGVNKEGKEGLQTQVIKMVSAGTGFAPKGHYVYNAFNINRTGKTGISGLPTTSSEGQRPSAVAFYAGRVWYAGVAHPDYQGKVYYTQIVEGDTNIGKCYQQNDPTSEQLSDLLDTDGGEIKITGMGRVAAMLEVGNSLILFANNGIWAISGSGAEGTGFVATDFSIKKLSNIGTEAANSFVDVEGTPVWWNYDGIWTLSQTEGVQSLTNDTIRTFIHETIPGISKKYIQGAYNSLTETIQWLWKSESPTSIADAYKYDRILEFNLKTRAFYPFKWNVDDQAFSTIFCANDVTATTLAEENVTDSSDVVVTNSASANVTAYVIENVDYISSQFKYFATNL